MLPSSRALRSVVAATSLAVTVGAALVVGGVVGSSGLVSSGPAVSAPASDTSTATSTDIVTTSSTSKPSSAGRCALVDRLPDALVAEIKRIRALPTDQRAAAIADLRERAAAGEFGRRATWWVERMGRGGFGPFGRGSSGPGASSGSRFGHGTFGGVRGPRADQVPDELRTALQAAWDLPLDERFAALDKIRTDALAGVYGAEVRAAAEKLRDHVDACLG